MRQTTQIISFGMNRPVPSHQTGGGSVIANEHPRAHLPESESPYTWLPDSRHPETSLGREVAFGFRGSCQRQSSPGGFQGAIPTTGEEVGPHEHSWNRSGFSSDLTDTCSDQDRSRLGPPRRLASDFLDRDPSGWRYAVLSEWLNSLSDGESR